MVEDTTPHKKETSQGNVSEPSMERVARLQALLRKAQKDLSALRLIHAEDLRKLADAEARVREMEMSSRRLAEANAHAVELLTSLEERNESLRNANQQIARANAHAAELVALVEIKEDEIERLNRALAAANAQAAELIADRELRLEEIQRLNHRLMDEVENRRRAESEVADLAERLRQANADLERLATLDPLTELYNRRGLERLLEAELHRAERISENIGVLFADFDDFKSINEHFGHSGGDAALRETARRLRESLRITDVLGRIGGDEFLALLPGIHEADLRTVATRFLETVSHESLRFGDSELRLTISVAAGMLPPDIVDLDGILRWSRDALRAAKEGGKNRIAFC